MTWLRARFSWLVIALLSAWIIFAALGPADLQLRFGMHWLVEHFAVFFVLTMLACIATRRPMLVAAILLPVSVGLEAAQGLTADRTPDIATALIAAGSVALAALLADSMLAWVRRHKSP